MSATIKIELQVKEPCIIWRGKVNDKAYRLVAIPYPEDENWSSLILETEKRDSLGVPYWGRFNLSNDMYVHIMEKLYLTYRNSNADKDLLIRDLREDLADLQRQLSRYI